MRSALISLAGAVFVTCFANDAAALQPPHDSSAGISCADCHQPHAALAWTGAERITGEAGTATTLIDGSGAWTPNEWVGGFVSFTSGVNDGQIREVIANDATTLTWSVPLPAPLAAGDAYRLHRNGPADQQTMCETCHNPTGMAAAMAPAAAHRLGDGTLIACGVCHDPHNVEPNSGPGAGLVRQEIRWPAARDTLTYPAPTNRLVVSAPPFDGVCETCHAQTSYHRNDASGDHGHNAATDCLTCHGHAGGFSAFDHVGAGAVLPVATCATCHATGDGDPVGDLHAAQCGLCHVDPLGGGPLVEPHESTSPTGGDCAACHAPFADSHQALGHTATLGSGSVMIFANDDHDDAGWIGSPPYFDVWVDCDGCHTSGLTAAHANDCATCHPTPYESLGTWSGGCQQGSCHPSFHADSTDAHWPFGDPSGPVSLCNQCHLPGVGAVVQSKCFNCHASLSGGDVTPPVTTSNAQASYVGSARIEFSISDGGMVGVGTTFHRVDSAPALTGGNLLVTAPGPHDLEFWSVDQAGNVEAPPNLTSFTIIADTTAPVTTANVQSTYYQGALITLTASDASSAGVMATYHSLDGGPAQTGTSRWVPPVTGTVSYTLTFWSEDWSGNVEAPNVAAFTVISGTGTLRLVWGDSDVSGPPTHPNAAAWWYIHRNNASGPIVASGAGSNPGWSGVDDVPVLVSPTPYYVDIWWWDTTYDWDDNTVYPDVYVQTPGEVVRLSY